MDPVYFSIPQVTRMLGVHRHTVYGWIEDGHLRASKWGADKRGVPYRIEQGDLLKFLSKHMFNRVA